MKVRLTGISAELMNATEIEISSANSVDEIKKELISRCPGLSGYEIKIAVNSVLTSGKEKIAGTDKILVFGPYAGG